MAADITIKNQGQGQSGDESDIAPVIDLRSAEPASVKGAPAQGTQGQGASTTGQAAQAPAGQGVFAAGQTGQASGPATATGGTPPVPPPTQPAAKKPAGISLEDEAMMAQTQTVIAPPEKYSVPSLVKEKFPDLVQLIKETESMNDQERDYWFQILPIMTEDQIRKFRDILLNEKNQLSRLDKEYEDELNRLNQKHMLEWKEFEMKEKRKALAVAETKSKEEEQAAEEELLKRLAQP